MNSTLYGMDGWMEDDKLGLGLTHQPWWQPTHEVGCELHHICIHSFIQLMDFLGDVSMGFSSFNMPLSITKLASKSPSLFVVMSFILQCPGAWTWSWWIADGWTIGCDNKFSFWSLDEWQDMMTILPLWKKSG